MHRKNLSFFNMPWKSRVFILCYSKNLVSLCYSKNLDYFLLEVGGKTSMEMVNLEMVNLLAGWKARCAEFFLYSTYFEGSQSSASPNSALNQICNSTENGSSSHPVADHNVESVASNGKLEAFKDLTIWQSRSCSHQRSYWVLVQGYIKFWTQVTIYFLCTSSPSL